MVKVQPPEAPPEIAAKTNKIATISQNSRPNHHANSRPKASNIAFSKTIRVRIPVSKATSDFYETKLSNVRAMCQIGFLELSVCVRCRYRLSAWRLFSFFAQ